MTNLKAGLQKNSISILWALPLVVAISCGQNTATSESQISSRIDLISPISILELGPGESKIIASFGTTGLSETSRIQLSLKARFHTTNFSEGSFPLMQIKVNGEAVQPEEVVNDPTCFKYPNCFWTPTCADHCNPYFVGDFSFDIECEEENIGHGLEESMFDIQVSPNFTNHTIAETQEGEPHQFYIDPNVSGDPYEYTLDFTERARNEDQLTIVIGNPFAEYADLAQCSGTGATEGILVLGDLRVRRVETE